MKGILWILWVSLRVRFVCPCILRSLLLQCFLCFCYRQQLDQMASELGMSSVRAFAEDVLSSSSGQRLAWLRRYYSSLDRPDLADMVANWFPEPSVGQSTSVVRPPSSPAPKPKCRRKVSPQKARGDSKARETPLLTPQKPPRIPQGRVAVGGCDIARGRKRTHRASVSSSAASRAAGVPCSDPAGSSSLEPCGEAAALDPAASGAAVGRTDRACPPSPHHTGYSPPSSPLSFLLFLGLSSSSSSPQRASPTRSGAGNTSRWRWRSWTPTWRGWSSVRSATSCVARSPTPSRWYVRLRPIAVTKPRRTPALGCG